MSQKFCNERLALLDQLLKDRGSFASGSFWTLDPALLRFRYGESIAELKVPYHLGREDGETIDEAVVGLGTLLRKRYEEDRFEEEESMPGIREAKEVTLREKTYKTDVLLPDSIEKKVAGDAILTVPLIDTAIIAAWLGTDGPGKKFIDWAALIIEKALKEEASSDGEERTSYLTLLMVIKSVKGSKEKIKKLRIKGISYEKLDLLVSLALFVAFRAALEGLLARLEADEVHYFNKEAAVLLESTLVPRAFLSIPSTLLSGSLNPYGISTDVFEGVSALVGGIEDAETGVDGLVKDYVSTVKKDKALVEKIRVQYRVMCAREQIMNYLTVFDIPGHEAHKHLYELYQEDRHIKALVEDPKMIDRVIGDIEKIKVEFPRDRRRAEAVDALQGFFQSYKKGKGFFGGAREETTEALNTVVLAFLAARFDGHVEKYAGHMRGCLADRREEFDDKMLSEEYFRGRLYRISVDKRHFLATLTREEEGQLFVDMKDFTKKTLNVKEIAMAEFMRENFYDPIIDAASRYAPGSVFLADERGIRMNSLPGDAAIFSGGVANLVSLAHDVQDAVRRYRDKLSKRLEPVKDEVILENVHKKFAARREELDKKMGALKKARPEGDKGPDKELEKLRVDSQRLEKTFRNELEAAISTEMEAGLFISYGPKAETMLIPPKKDFSGQIKVAIGEKINEAARGTDRNSTVRAKLEMLIEKERGKRNNQKLQYPFDIYIDSTYAIRMPLEMDEVVEALAGGAGGGGAGGARGGNPKAMAEAMASGFYNDLKKLERGEPFGSLRFLVTSTDIYNRGSAISNDALEAYMRETKGASFFFRKVVKPAELDVEIRNSFFFPSDEIEFWFGVEVKKGVETVEGFAFIGEVVFKGFESAPPTVVYEILDNEGPFFRALNAYHFSGWRVEAKKA